MIIKLIDKNQNQVETRVYSTSEFNKTPKHYEVDEYDLLVNRMNEFEDWIGKAVVDGPNYTVELSINVNGEWKHILILNRVEGYVMNDTGQTVDRI